MTLRSLLLLLPPLGLGLALTGLLWPGRLRAGWPLALAAGFGLGLGAASLLYYAWLRLAGPAGASVVGVEAGLAVILTGLALVRRRGRWGLQRPSFDFVRRPGAWLAGGLSAACAALAGLSAYAFVGYSLRNPYGTFDAYAIWNLRARFIYLAGSGWGRAFSPLLSWKAHADYPLLIPLNVLRLWELLGEMSQRAPLVLSLSFTLALAGAVYAALAAHRDAGQAALGGALVLGAPALLTTGLTQNADNPLAFYLLLSGALLYTYAQDSRPAWLALAGLCAGLAGWTKNEGLALLVAAALSLLTFGRGGLRGLGFFLAGAALPLAAVIDFKLALAPPSDLFAGQTIAGILGRLLTPARYAPILLAFGRELLLALGGWNLPLLPLLAAYALALRRRLSARESAGLRMLLGTAGFTLLAYAGIFLITPHPLEWHLQYALDRLAWHTYPALVLAVLLAARSPVDLLSDWNARQDQSATP